MKVFNTFSCIELRSGQKVMSVAPEVVCWETQEHGWMVVVSSLVIVLYVLGVPMYVFVVTWIAKRYDKFKSPVFLKIFGFLYIRYGAPLQSHPSQLVRVHAIHSSESAEPEFYFWELAFLSRRLAFCICLVVFRQSPYLQGVRLAARLASRALADASARFRTCIRRGAPGSFWVDLDR
jgi:hypothetical protein